jgi:hypothetical protein
LGAGVAIKLTARKVETAKPGKYSEGGNLYLIVSETGARKWVLRFHMGAATRRDGAWQRATFRSPTPARRPPVHAERLPKGLNN